ncbi:MAG: Uma2 family endonuclease [Dehalococcoidia bacterium]
MAVVVAPARSPGREPSIPALENGDHLTRDEFERRWDAHPELKRAELIDGVVFLEMTVGRRHGKHHSLVVAWLGSWVASHPDYELITNTSVRLLDNQELQPDVAIRFPDGDAATNAPVDGPPELVVEVASTSASRDLHRKREIYLAAGVQEYVVWRLDDRRIDWWQNRHGRWISLEPDSAGRLTSASLPGLVLDVPAMLNGDLHDVLAATTTNYGRE